MEFEVKPQHLIFYVNYLTLSNKILFLNKRIISPLKKTFFHSCLFFWRPVGVWGYSLRCPRSECPAKAEKNTFLYRCGYSKAVRQICHMSGWYSMLTEVLACNACRKAAKESEQHTIGRFLAWDMAVINQLSPAHRAVFPAVLTRR